MNKPSFERSAPSESLPDYMRPFDTDHPIPEYKEQLEATALLRATLEEKILATIHGLGNASANAGVYSVLHLDSFDFNGEPMEIDVYCANTFVHPDLDPYEVRLSEGPRYIGGSFMRIHTYIIPDKYGDEGVRRRDDVLPEPHPFSVKDLAGFEMPVIIDSKVVGALGALADAIEADRHMERVMGLNDQPIGLNEAQLVSMLISRSTLRPEKLCYKSYFG